ncbi:hypothetical protein RU85_GL001676 [Lactococcus garvieae]|nr:hypothetical protein RU85_GL001676 [Lactococcus garvieae]
MVSVTNATERQSDRKSFKTSFLKLYISGLFLFFSEKCHISSL